MLLSASATAAALTFNFMFIAYSPQNFGVKIRRRLYGKYLSRPCDILPHPLRRATPVESIPMNSSLLATQTGHSHLRRLFLLRCGAILAQFAILILVHRFLSKDFAWLPMLGAG